MIYQLFSCTKGYSIFGSNNCIFYISPMIKNEKPPATIIPTDIRPCQVHGAGCIHNSGLMAEKRTGLVKFLKKISCPQRDHYKHLHAMNPHPFT
jgi:hypothetical protein